ncbi:hypothetical protein B8281_15980 [Cellulosimicrobium sp. TH-20]|uniref:hypothetical protein n=1 Tax=Cellulosimicrobium sp. TH-20 TaxID=1980001 RepID=UPI000A17C5A6|nr:hypothetical protein [Cellulosimicrobium sp. TH-20]ARK05991.1 hypothetical protein B8281_15980 [Cellulosimicrobium sp. TH-20]
MKRMPVTAATIAAVASVAVGCTSTGPVDPGPTASDTGPEYTDVAAGAEITAEQAELLPPGQRAYELQDGRLVVIDEENRTPDAVVDDLLNEGLAVPASLPEDATDLEAVYTAHAASSDFIAEMRERGVEGVYVLRPTVATCDGSHDSEAVPGWMGSERRVSRDGETVCQFWPGAVEGAIQGARDFIAEDLGEDVSEWTILVLDGEHSQTYQP